MFVFIFKVHLNCSPANTKRMKYLLGIFRCTFTFLPGYLWDWSRFSFACFHYFALLVCAGVVFTSLITLRKAGLLFRVSDKRPFVCKRAPEPKNYNMIFTGLQLGKDTVFALWQCLWSRLRVYYCPTVCVCDRNQDVTLLYWAANCCHRGFSTTTSSRCNYGGNTAECVWGSSAVVHWKAS